MLEIAEKPLWWLVLMFIPVANFIVAILVLVELTKKYDKPATIITWALIPIVSVFLVKNTNYIGSNTGVTNNSVPNMTPPTSPTPPTAPTIQ